MSRAMKDSGIEWIGEIPEDWNTCRVKQCVTTEHAMFSDGDWIESPFITDNGIRLIQTGNIGDGTYKEQGFRFISEKTFFDLQCKYVYPGDVLISRLASPVGRACIAPCLSEKMICAVDVCILRPDKGIDSRYLTYYFTLSGYLEHADLISRGTTLQRISRTQLGFICVILPPFRIQLSIANFLDAKCALIDFTIEKQKSIIEKLKQYKQSIITEAVTKGLDPKVKMKPSGIDWIGDIPEGWIKVRLKNISNAIGDGLHGTPAYSGNGNYCFINGTNLGNKSLFIGPDTNMVNEEEYRKYAVLLDSNTLLISLNGTIGNLSYYDNEPIILSKSAGYIKLKTEVNRDFIYYYLQSDYIKMFFELSFAGTTINNLSLETLRNTPVFLPSGNQQKAIVGYLKSKIADIDTVLTRKRSLCDKLMDYQKSLIYECVTGKREVS